MAIVLILGLVVLGTAVAMIAHAILRPRAASLAVVNQIGQYGFSADVALPDEEETGGLDRLATNVGGYLGKRISWFRDEDVRLKLVSAGMYGVTPARFLGYQALASLTFLLLGVWAGGSAGYSVFKIATIAIAAAAMGWLAPLVYVNTYARRRREAIDYELPELIDFLIVAIEAGMSLSGSMRLAATELSGALGEEMRLTLQEHNMGLSTSQTLENLNARADTPGMRMFVRSIIQGEALGISIGQVMRNLASEMRKRRKAAAEERAQKAPVKMVFPLVLLIFPPMFAVLVVPALINISRALP